MRGDRFLDEMILQNIGAGGHSDPCGYDGCTVSNG
ncbi:MAG: hypothetical protein FFODKBPE_00161 [Candidatus Argoarchaeum ethanivorans]|uniref:Uncharacterized protein n=1 Tax=Candidatus Argoarchaeum ethanivorans TaxID=2608793 RepID=A0A811T808_9EURY|nr:MAG: hypothetical protein FFODKBPE_00161 [Candidatus Argoarchaeum ethanivorans]